jgi:hypothetical protein
MFNLKRNQIMSEQKQKPVKTLKSGRLEASIWRQEVTKDGKTFIQHSIKIKKQFQDEQGEYQDTNYFFPSELHRLILLATKAYEYIALQESPEPEETEDIPV